MAIVKKSPYMGGGSAGSIPWELNDGTLDKLSDPSIRLTNLTIQYGLRINKITWSYSNGDEFESAGSNASEQHSLALDANNERIFSVTVGQAHSLHGDTVGYMGLGIINIHENRSSFIPNGYCNSNSEHNDPLSTFTAFYLPRWEIIGFYGTGENEVHQIGVYFRELSVMD